LILWFLNFFGQFRDLSSLAQMQAEKVAEFDVVSAQLEEKRADCMSLQIDLDNLRASHDELVTEKRLLEDRLQSALNDKDKLWEQMQEALDNERYALRSQVNVFCQRSGGGIPYSEAHSIPPELAPRPQKSGPIGRAGRRLPSEAAARASADFVHAYYAPPGESEKPS